MRAGRRFDSFSGENAGGRGRNSEREPKSESECQTETHSNRDGQTFSKSNGEAARHRAAGNVRNTVADSDGRRDPEFGAANSAADPSVDHGCAAHGRAASSHTAIYSVSSADDLRQTADDVPDRAPAFYSNWIAPECFFNATSENFANPEANSYSKADANAEALAIAESDTNTETISVTESDADAQTVPVAESDTDDQANSHAEAQPLTDAESNS